MRNIKAVFVKQMLSYFKNSAMFATPAFFLGIPFFMLLLLPGLRDDYLERTMIVSQFVIMFIGISTIGAAAAFIAEDRSTMNLRFMSMAGVKPYQYLIATGAALLVTSLAANILFALLLGFSGDTLVGFLIISMLGATCSMLLGITFGLSKFAPFTMIISLLLGVGPIFAGANDTLASIFNFVYTYQVNSAIRSGGAENLESSIRITLINIAVLLVIFIVTNMRNGLDGKRVVQEEKNA